MLPKPRWTGAGKWSLDLRAWGLGRHVLDAPPPPTGEVLAVHAAYALLERLRSATPAQPLLPGLDTQTFAHAVREFLEFRSRVAGQGWRSEGGERWTREICQRLLRELGQRPLAAFAPPPGSRMLAEYKHLLRASIGAKRCQDILTVLEQVLRFAVHPDRAWLSAVPEMPDPRTSSAELIRVPRDKWIDESSFRAARAELYGHPVARNGLLAELRRRDGAATVADARDLVERRRLLLSFAFYTGMRRYDLWTLDDRSVSADLGRYGRRSHKTGSAVSVEVCPPPMLADLRRERARLGRPWRRGEAICGGRWKNVARVLGEACRRAGVEIFNLMDCRRSFVWHKAAAGVPEEDIVRLLGHRDSRMIRTVYQQHLPAQAADAASAAWPAPLSSLPGTGGARILSIRREGKDEGA